MRTIPKLAPALTLLALTACSESIDRGLGAFTTGSGTGGTTATSATGGMPGPSDVPWSKSFGAPMLWGSGEASGLTSDDSVMAVTWEEQNPGPAGPSHLRRFDPAGNAVLDTSVDDLDCGSVAPDGSAIVAFDGLVGGASTILGKPVSCGGDACAGLARIGADGTVTWVQTLAAHGAGAYVDIYGLRIVADGRIAVAGAFGGTLDLGVGPLEPDSTDGTIFVAEMTPEGAPVWNRAVDFYYPPGAGFMGWIYVDMDVSPAGDMLISGQTNAPVDYGAGMMAASYQSGFFARYDAAGNVIHGGVLPSETISPIGVAVDPAGNAVLAAWIYGTFDLGGGVTGTPGENQLYLIRFDAKGHLLASAPVARGAWSSASFVAAVDGAGNAWLCGGASPIELADGTTVQSVSESDVLLLELDPAGALVGKWQFGKTGSLFCEGIRIGPSGVPVIYGGMDGSADFGQGLLQAIGPMDVFIAKLGPGGP